MIGACPKPFAVCITLQAGPWSTPVPQGTFMGRRAADNRAQMQLLQDDSDDR